MDLLFVYPLSVDGHLGWFQFLAIANNAAVNFVPVQVFVQTCFHLCWAYTWQWDCWGTR